MIFITFTFSLVLIILITKYVVGSKKNNKKSLFLFLFFSISTLSIYFFKGNFESYFFEKKLNKELEIAMLDPEKFKKINPNKLIFFLEKKLKKEPADIKGWLILARTCILTGYYQKADAYYKKSLTYFPDNENVLIEYSILKKNTNQTKSAKELLIMLKELFPENVKGREILIEILISNLNYNLAKKEIEELKELKKDDIKYIEEIKEKFNFKAIQDF